MDVVISADRQVVVSHEPWLNPQFCLAPNGKIIPPDAAHSHNLYQIPYATIRRCECGMLQHPGFPDQVSEPAYKPLLREVLSIIERATVKLARPPVGYSIEIKSGPSGDGVFHPAPPEFLSLVLAELGAAGVLPRTTLLCFDERILQLAHHTQPALATCLLVENSEPWMSSIQHLGFVPAVFGPYHRTVSTEAVAQLRATHPGLRLVPWTVNEPEEMRQLLTLGVDGITTDYPDRLLTLLDMMY
jgi:glycerophosphoryl diester phosphodiesterase